jgi:hypothetical protein
MSDDSLSESLSNEGEEDYDDEGIDIDNFFFEDDEDGAFLDSDDDSDSDESSADERVLVLSKTVIWDEDDTEATTDDNDNSEGGDPTRKDQRFGYVYTIRLDLYYTPLRWERAFHVEANVTFKPRQEEIVGEENIDRFIYSFVPDSSVMAYMNAILLVRPHDAAAMPHPDVSRLFSVLFEEDETLRIRHPALFQQEKHERGGLLSILQAEVHPDHRGKDLALRMAREVLIFLQDPPLIDVAPLQLFESASLARWTIAALIPAPFPNRRWKHSDLKFPLAELFQPRKKLARHFARLGFVQAARSREDGHAWFLTRSMFFGEHGQSISINGDSLERRERPWLSKSEVAQSINVYETPSEPDYKLHNIWGRMNHLSLSCEHFLARVEAEIRSVESDFQRLDVGVQFRDRIDQIQDVLTAAKRKLSEQRAAARHKCHEVVRILLCEGFEDGPAIDRSLGFHYFASKVSGDDMIALETIVKMGGNVNLADKNGQTPLHAAVQALKPQAIRYLLSVGGDSSLRDSQNMTPLDLLLCNWRSQKDFNIVAGRIRKPPEESEVVPVLESIQALLTHSNHGSVKLIDSWLSPRMQKLLETIAKEEYISLATKLQMLSLQKEGTTHTAVNPWEVTNRVRYIPHKHVASIGVDGNKSNAMALLNGMKLIWSTLFQLLHRNEAPTVQNVVNFISTCIFWDLNLKPANHQETLSSFIGQGGKIEFIIDAMLDIAEERNCVETTSDDNGDAQQQRQQQEEIASLPPSPLDDMFDIARFMCISRGGGTWSPYFKRGPFSEEDDEVPAEQLPPERLNYAGLIAN